MFEQIQSKSFSFSFKKWNHHMKIINLLYLLLFSPNPFEYDRYSIHRNYTRFIYLLQAHTCTNRNTLYHWYDTMIVMTAQVLAMNISHPYTYGINCFYLDVETSGRVVNLKSIRSFNRNIWCAPFYFNASPYLHLRVKCVQFNLELI